MRSGLEIARDGLKLNYKKTDFVTIDIRCECCFNGVQKWETDKFGWGEKKICQECWELLD